MIPRLYPGTETAFTKIGTALSDCISCTVKEERNGVFELTAVVSSTTPYFDTLKEGMLIVAKPNHTQTPQAFEIYEISSPINQQVTIRANHVSYRQSFIPVTPFSCTGITATLAGLISNSMETNPFTFSTDITNEASTYNQTVPASFRSRLGGTEGSVLDVFGGEYEWDNFVVKLWQHRGADNGVQLRLAKNITELKQTVNLDRVVTGVLPWWHDDEGDVNLYGTIQYSSAVGDYATPRTIVLDLSEQFSSAPSAAQLNTAGAQYLTQVSLATPNKNIAVQFVDLADTTEYSDSPLERVNLCDTVQVIYPALNISYSAKVIKVVFDVLAERTLEVEVGDTKSTISKTIADLVGDVSAVVTTGKRLVSVTQRIDREVGEITQTVSAVEETANGALDLANENSGSIDALSNDFSTTITNLQTQIQQNADGISLSATKTEVQDKIDGVNASITDVQADVSDLSTNIENVQISITSMQAAISALQNGVGKAFVVDTTGTKVYAVQSGDIVPGTYTLTDEDGNHFYVDDTQWGWATANGFGTVQLTIGKTYNTSNTTMWQIYTDNDNRLIFSWHS